MNFKSLLPFASLLLLIVSCQREEMETNGPEGATQGKTVLREVIISAEMQEESSPDTRTVLMMDESVNPPKQRLYWLPRDTIKLFSNGESAMFVSTNTEPTRKAKFSGYISFVIGDDGETETDYVWGLYPYRADAEYFEPEGSTATAVITTTLPDHQTGKPGTFDSGLATMIGRSETLTFSYKAAYSGVYFRFDRDDVVSVTLRGRHNEVLAGRFVLGLDDNLNPEVKSIVSGSTSVTVHAPGGGTFEPGQNYYIVTLPDVQLEEGYSLTVTRSNGMVATFKSLTTINDLPRNGCRNFTNPLDTYIENETYIANGRSTGWKDSSIQRSYVDLGLSVKWAMVNLGAFAPEEYGDYFAWGEVEPKASYSWANYKWSDGTENSITKYCLSSLYGQVDGLSILERQDDAASINLGEGWMIPTKEEWTELRDNCSWTWTTVNGIEGFLISGKKAGFTENSIFLPAAGIWKESTFYPNNNSPWSVAGSYWSGSLGNSNTPYNLDFDRLGVYVDNNVEGYRYTGQSIRPVWTGSSSSIAVTEISIDPSSLSLSVETSATLTATVLPENATNKNVTWTCLDESVATVDPQGNVNAVAPGTTTITATTEDGGFTATCEVTVIDPSVVSAISLNRTALSLIKGSSETLSADILPSTASSQGITWSSSNTNVATVSSSGTVSGINEGMATITAQCGDITATCSVDVFEVVRDDFNPNTYLLYRANTTVTSGDNYYSIDSEFPGISGAKVELKFQLTGPSMITSGNMNRDYYDYMNISNYWFEWNDATKDEDGDWYDDTLEWRIPSATSLLWIKFDGVNHTMTINETVSSCSRSTMSLPRLFATYDHESDEGIYEVTSGVPEGSKLYYAKAWNEDGSLKTIGYATTSENPATNRVEYCWCTYSPKTGNVVYTFAHDAIHQGGFEGYTYN